jgi:hypothetical protein
MLMVVYLSILQYKLVFLNSHGTLSDRFAVVVEKRDKIKWFLAELTAFTVSQQSLTFSALINYTLSAAKLHLNYTSILHYRCCMLRNA